MCIWACKYCFKADLKNCIQLRPAERGGGGRKLAVKWSMITALEYEQVEGERREGERGEQERRREDGGFSSVTTWGGGGVTQGLKVERQKEGVWGGGGGGGLLIQPSQWVDVTCLHTQQCASIPPRSQKRDSCTMSRLIASCCLTWLECYQSMKISFSFSQYNGGDWDSDCCGQVLKSY